jgi:SAM-dependent methyltransferase
MDYWQNRWLNQQTGWDLGVPSPPLVAYLSQIPDTQRQAMRVLMPGCGNGYEAIWMAENGFRQVTMLDIAQAAVDQMAQRSATELSPFATPPELVCGDFFEHTGQYELILEQTFFCAIDPALRADYVHKMHDLLVEGGKLVGVLFDREFEGGPPFGGSSAAYRVLFAPFFHIHAFAPCYNSAAPRAGTEIFMVLEKL